MFEFKGKVSTVRLLQSYQSGKYVDNVDRMSVTGKTPEGSEFQFLAPLNEYKLGDEVYVIVCKKDEQKWVTPEQINKVLEELTEELAPK